MTTLTLRNPNFSNIDKFISHVLTKGVGFEPIFNLFEGDLLDKSNGYPPYNIEKLDDNAYAVSVAVAGFAEDDLSVSEKDGVLVVSGSCVKHDSSDRFLHKGIASRDFTRQFQLADQVDIESAEYINGILTVKLVKHEQEREVRKIPITKKEGPRTAVYA